jgi:fumarylacetoacetate (FAA) hydrolase
MKLVTYNTGTGPRCGVLQDDSVIDVTVLLNAAQPLRDVQALLETGDDAIALVQAALQGSNSSAPVFALEDVQIQSPILRPPTIRDFMIFEEHATQQGTREREEAWYRMPIFYFSNPLCVYGPEDTVPHPSASHMLDYELEIGCVIGKEGTNVAEADALEYIAGFLIFNDWSARDLQRDESAVGLGPAKGKDTASTLGPWVVTTDEMAPYIRDGRLSVKCQVRVNGESWLTDGDAAMAYYTWGEIVQRASKDSRIAPGDVIGSGTVGGGSVREAIRKGYEAARFLEPGDVVEMEVDGIGAVRNTLGEKTTDPSYPFPAASPTAVPDRGTHTGYRYELSR